MRPSLSLATRLSIQMRPVARGSSRVTVCRLEPSSFANSAVVPSSFSDKRAPPSPRQEKTPPPTSRVPLVGSESRPHSWIPGSSRDRSPRLPSSFLYYHLSVSLPGHH